MQTRYYDPEVGRFINADDARILGIGMNVIGGTNLFAYCLNNPVMEIDANGEFVLTLTTLALIASIGLVGTGTIYLANEAGVFKSLGGGIEYLAGHLVNGANVIISYVESAIDNYTYRKSGNKAPTLRPGIKTQGGETSQKKRDGNWEDKSGRRPPKPKKHTPGRDHRKYPALVYYYDIYEIYDRYEEHQ